jgi:hypothetical protein
MAASCQHDDEHVFHTRRKCIDLFSVLSAFQKESVTSSYLSSPESMLQASPISYSFDFIILIIFEEGTN